MKRPIMHIHSVTKAYTSHLRRATHDRHLFCPCCINNTINPWTFLSQQEETTGVAASLFLSVSSAQ
eukprot:m.1645832 g.1645832  ORF g.1645832 m.1645832 type:complete len:66 (+) comp68795_c0_seq1:145-342(+)